MSRPHSPLPAPNPAPHVLPGPTGFSHTLYCGAGRSHRGGASPARQCAAGLDRNLHRDGSGPHRSRRRHFHRDPRPGRPLRADATGDRSPGRPGGRHRRIGRLGSRGPPPGHPRRRNQRHPNRSPGSRPHRITFRCAGRGAPGQIGTVIDLRVDAVDLTATVIDLAVRGYLWIAETTGAEGRLDWQISRRAPADSLLAPMRRNFWTSCCLRRPRRCTCPASRCRVPGWISAAFPR